jgi:NTE family protein
MGRGLSGVLDGFEVERTYRKLLGDRCLGDLEIPAYAVVWNAEHSRLEYLGPKTAADMPVVTAVRLAVTLPLMIEGAPLADEYWYDGGIIDIFPVRPLLDIEPPSDVVIAVNGFYRPDFTAQDISGWMERTLSILSLAEQARSMQHLHIAQQNLARLREETEVIVLDPVP